MFATTIKIIENYDVLFEKSQGARTLSNNFQMPENILDPINPNEATFSKILIANRGEIACRIIKTAREMGIKTVAVYSVADAQSPHVKLADEAIFIGPSMASQSYLSIQKILEAIKSSGVDAVHPGYGFLSENAAFVSKLEEENIAFIGPPTKAIVKMGDKLESKRFALAADVNTIPGYNGILEDEVHCIRICQEIGYPVMIKASAGGGGIGMRTAKNDTEAREGFKLSSKEAKSGFGDSRIIVEKFIMKPRHVEIQVLGDKYGHAIHLNERECSIQRRHQKVIEEAPSAFLSEDLRRKMGNQAVRLCKKLNYYSAGTVEFLIDKNYNFYFLEMNTRLQVEHPVTECITGVDLVQQMIKIAAGYPLKINQDDVKINGWAIESRVYAEDAYANFGLPSIGRLYKYIEPNRLPGVRCDSGIEEGSEISFYYDSMICKLVCYGKDRQEAIERSIKALDYYIIRGVAHNISLLRDILTEESFVEGNLNTNYLSEIYPSGFHGHQLMEDERNNLLAIAAALYAANELRNRKFLNGPTVQIHEKMWHKWDVVISLKGQDHTVHIGQINNSFKIKFDNKVFSVNKTDINLVQQLIEAKVNDNEVVMQLVQRKPNGEYKLIYQGTTYDLSVMSTQAVHLLRLMPQKLKMDVSKIIKTPMPGLVKSVSCKVGDLVEEGQELCIIEAMKMQNAMVALSSGEIKAVRVKEGETVGDDDILIELE